MFQVIQNLPTRIASGKFKVLTSSVPVANQFNSTATCSISINNCAKRLSSQSSTSGNMKRFQGKVAIVTASTDGIGFAIAKRLAEDGANVVISSRKEKNVANAVEKLRKLNLNVMGLKCHVAEASDRKQLFEETMRKYGKLNILVSNAAANPAVGPVLDCEENVWDKIFDINVKSSYLLAKEALPYLRKEKGSSIVFVSSIAGYDAFELLGAYSVSKTALIGLTKAASKDLAPEGIRVNCLAPGIIKTKFSQALHEEESANEAALARIPMRRLGMPDEMAGIVAFLVSDDASYITGESIVASGGMTARL
ncbi:dehydrogenase/reductase SDR family member 4 [Teleopsis dalmanni]|uniref:dehydrogenase/reductase SDR family member 4-like n=1 Tax=Teleopsis dalmanni TaxID=139649 RepID=UPI0018CE27E5|nr:dehydrogenase/reductase SDR family member 4-like [Teleopsis dalmanni]XP_037935137.1 dehydrogenase/reductase SDR family member 4 [Teleopsis dalmanni]